MKIRLVFMLLIVLVSFSIGRSQESETNELSQTSIPETIKQDIVSRILAYNFKSARRKKIVLLANKDINPSWLPKIPNVEFKLLSEVEVEDSEKGVYFFTKTELVKKTYSIGFAFGDPQCDYTGNGWRFRITDKRHKLWYVGGIVGGCTGSGGGTVFKISGELNKYPYELAGYKFFDNGKLKGLKLTVSTKEDVKKNFGSDCKITCDYDNNWTIHISYFGSITKEMTIDNKRVKYVPKEELIGKIYSIRFIPKNRLSISRFVFPKKFQMIYSFSVGDAFDSKGHFKAARGTRSKTYIDRYGLQYQVFESGYTVGEVKKVIRNKGDLISIEYAIPEEIEAAMFVEEQEVLK